MIAELLKGDCDEVVAKWQASQGGKLTEAQKMAQTIVLAARDGDIRAAQLVLDRTEGKAIQPVEVPDPIVHDVKMSIERISKSGG